MNKSASHQMSVFGKVFKYRVRELNTEFRLPGGGILTFTNWDVKGVRERFYKEEYLNPEVHYNMPKETELSEFGITAVDVQKFIQSREETFDPLPSETKKLKIEHPAEPITGALEPELSEAKGA